MLGLITCDDIPYPIASQNKADVDRNISGLPRFCGATIEQLVRHGKLGFTFVVIEYYNLLKAATIWTNKSKGK